MKDSKNHIIQFYTLHHENKLENAFHFTFSKLYIHQKIHQHSCISYKEHTSNIIHLNSIEKHKICFN